MPLRQPSGGVDSCAKPYTLPGVVCDTRPSRTRCLVPYTFPYTLPGQAVHVVWCRALSRTRCLAKPYTLPGAVHFLVHVAWPSRTSSKPYTLPGQAVHVPSRTRCLAKPYTLPGAVHFPVHVAWPSRTRSKPHTLPGVLVFSSRRSVTGRHASDDYRLASFRPAINSDFRQGSWSLDPASVASATPWSSQSPCLRLRQGPPEGNHFFSETSSMVSTATGQSDSGGEERHGHRSNHSAHYALCEHSDNGDRSVPTATGYAIVPENATATSALVTLDEFVPNDRSDYADDDADNVYFCAQRNYTLICVFEALRQNQWNKTYSCTDYVYIRFFSYSNDPSPSAQVVFESKQQYFGVQRLYYDNSDMEWRQYSYRALDTRVRNAKIRQGGGRWMLGIWGAAYIRLMNALFDAGKVQKALHDAIRSNFSQRFDMSFFRRVRHHQHHHM
ncbi:hypothetical protein MRX96_021896 [Rhipicephalus microplus]